MALIGNRDRKINAFRLEKCLKRTYNDDPPAMNTFEHMEWLERLGAYLGIDPRFIAADMTRVLDQCFMKALVRWSDENESLSRDLAIALLITGGHTEVVKIFSQEDQAIRSRLVDEGGFSLQYKTGQYLARIPKTLYSLNHIVFPRKATLEIGDWMNEIYYRDPSNSTLTRGQEDQAYRYFISNLRIGFPNLKIIDCYCGPGFLPVTIRGDIQAGLPNIDQNAAQLSLFTYKTYSPWD